MVLGNQAGKVLFDNVLVGNRRGEFATNLTCLIKGLYNDEVHKSMNRFLAEFLIRVPTHVRFTEHLRSEVLARREVLIQEKETERKLILGLKYESQD